MTTIKVQPLTRESFQQFGDVIEAIPDGKTHAINAGTTQRFHDLATSVALGEEARTIISIGRAQPFAWPIEVKLLERHPEGSQAFVPLAPSQFVVMVAPDDHNVPGAPQAFLAQPGQGINYFVGTWHAPLMALETATDFLIVDREGLGPNLQEHKLAKSYWIEK